MVVMAPSKKSKHNLPFQKREVKQILANELNEENEMPNDLRIIAQEVKIVKSLACNDLTQRNKQMKKLRRWLHIRTQSSFPFGQEDFMRIWKGLYYNMWYSDKPLVQEKLAEQLGKLFECFTGNLEYCVNFFGAFLKTMCIEWFGIDQWRIDKFLMLARRMLRYMFTFLKLSDWSLDAIEIFNKHATETVLFENVSAKGLTMHYLDIFLEELAKVSEGNISAEQVGMFVKPFVKFMATQRDFNLISHCRTRIFCHLLYQSALGREYTEKYNAWKAMGFPTKHINDLEKIEESENGDIEEESSEENLSSSKFLDPRAGNVDVFIAELPLDAELIIKEIEYFLYKEECSTKRRKFLKKLFDLFTIYKNGDFPLGIKTMPRFEGKSEEPLIKKKIRELDNMENELYGVDRELKQMTKRKRRKFLRSLNFDEIDESNYEQTIEKELPKEYLKERRKRSHKSFMSSWIEEELNEEDLKPTKIRKVAVNEYAQDIPTKKKINLQNFKNKKSVLSIKNFKEKKTSIRETENDTSVRCNGDGVCNTNSLSNQQPASIGLEPQVNLTPSFIQNDDDEKKIGDGWDAPLMDGEIEYFLRSRKLQLKKANDNLVLNPLAKQRLCDNQSTPDNVKSFSATNSPKISSIKRVKIALKRNTSQNPLEYIQQIKSSPDIPYDAKRKPGKGLLKPNAMPSPINPFYKKKIGLKLLNDTF